MRGSFPNMLCMFLVLTVGCEKKQPAASTTTTTSTTPQWIDLDDDDEDDDMDDLMAIELMKAVADCGDIKKMEPAAMMGKLTDGEIRCLDEKLRTAERQTFKDKLSRVVMADAWAKGDTHRWEGIVRYHLNEVDRSDPDLCYKFSLHLSKRSGEFADETMKWVDVALENRAHWSGDLFTRRVNSLRKLKAMSATMKWSWLEDKAAKDRTDININAAVGARNDAKTYAREWLEYAKKAGKDTTQAMQLCISAAGTSEFCEIVDP